ncbi:MAG TPA: hypothetical protein VNZ86_20570, partial [Bacteroidia bacterium]|nr:hypothetical protein [Bacteroidia bacterium]
MLEDGADIPRGWYAPFVNVALPRGKVKAEFPTLSIGPETYALSEPPCRTVPLFSLRIFVVVVTIWALVNFIESETVIGPLS